jgi:hypothetical protein
MLAARGRVSVTPGPNACGRERDDHLCITRSGTGDLTLLTLCDQRST